MKIDRLLSIVMLLLERQTMSAKAMADMFEVSLRTIYRDMESINQAGIPVVSTPGVHGGFEIMREYKLDKRLFTPADLTAILMGLGSLSSMPGSEEWVHTQAKVRSLLPLRQAQEIELKSAQIAVDLKPWMGNGAVTAALDLFKSALRVSRLVAFAYSDRSGVKTERRVEPYRLLLKDNRWYLHGYCLERNDFRLFKLSRMAEPDMQEDTFTPRQAPAPEADFSSIMAKKQQEITLRFTPALLDRIQEHCGPDNVHADGNGGYTASFPFIADDLGYSLLLSYGDQCECLAPREVRSELAERVKRMMRVYEQTEA